MRGRVAPEVRGSHRFSKAPPGVAHLAALLLGLCLAGSVEATSPPEDAASRQLLSAAGRPTPGFILPDLAGEPLRLQDGTGRIVLVHFFATWCEPCREELASLSGLIAGPLGKRVAILAVNVAEVPLRVRRFLDSAHVSFPVGLDADRAVTRAWGVSTLPTTFVLDASLQPRLFVEGDVDWSRPDIVSALEALDVTNAK